MELLDSDKFVCHCVFNCAVGKLVCSFVSSIPTVFCQNTYDDYYACACFFALSSTVC